MRWGAMLAVIVATGFGTARADNLTSPVFGSSDQTPFQIVVDAATGKPLVEKVSTQAGVAVVK